MSDRNLTTAAFSHCDAVPYFEGLFSQTADPWGFRTRWYEARKRAMTLAILPEQRYTSGFEPGCANGELSFALAARCDNLLVSDGATGAVAAARLRLAPLRHVRVLHAWLPQQWPDGLFDLIVLSELAYYFDAATLTAVVGKVRASLRPGGTVLACHWRRPIAGCVHAGDAVHRLLDTQLKLQPLSSTVEADFRLDVWRNDGDSVAQREGLA